MNYPEDLLILSSFKEYLDHTVIEKLGAWKNSTVPLFLDSTDDRRAGYKKISSGPNQWVYDSSISGAVVADPAQFSGVSWQAAKTDFKNSRFLVPSSVNETLPTTATLAVKHFNSYLSIKSDEDLFTNTKFNFEPEMLSQSSGTRADSYHGPCYFVKFSDTRNEGLAFGGLDKTIYTIKIISFVENEAELLSLASVFRDLKNKNTMVLNSTPLDEFNNIKSRPWSFHNEILAAQASGNPVISIEDSTFNPLKITKLSNIHMGLGIFSISVARYPRR
jgi:hypothetical protein